MNDAELGQQTIYAAYVYLLGRALIARQEQLDLAEAGVDYNTVKHNPVGRPLEWVNPNLDVTNSEAWIAVDETTPAVLNLPVIHDRYYTVQIIDEWGEVITNINERNYPRSPNGTFAFVSPGSHPDIPSTAIRIDLRSNKAKMLARIELAGEPTGAVALQHQISLTSPGGPSITPSPMIPSFDNHSLLGVEIFDSAEALLTSAIDVSPVAAQMQATVRAVAASAADPGARARLDALLRQEIVPAFQRFAVQDAGETANNWMGTTTIGTYGDQTAIRTAANYVGIWANARDEVIYFVTTRDSDGDTLDGAESYVLEFSPAEHPDTVVNAYWSLSLVDVPNFIAVPNAINRYSFNSVTPPPSEPDGTLHIYLAPHLPSGSADSNWLPTPTSGPFSLTFRTYVPKDIVKRGEWFPPGVEIARRAT